MFEKIAEHIFPWLEGKYASPYRVCLIPTDKCNLGCRSCWRWEVIDRGDDFVDGLPEDKLISLIQEGAELGVKEWELSGGGEPFLRKKTLMRMIKEIKKLNMRGEITTNGTLLTISDVRFLVEVGWDHIIISLDGPSPQINDYLRPPLGTFNKIISTLELIKKYKSKLGKKTPTITILCVLSRKNLNYIYEMINLASEFEVNEIFFQPVIYFTDRCKELVLENTDYEKIKKQYKKAQELAKFKGVITNLEYLINIYYPQKEGVKEDFKKFGLILNKYRWKNLLEVPCYEPWYRLYINTNGDTTCCCIIEYFKNENVKLKSLREIWLSENFEKLRSRILTQELFTQCRQCLAGLVLHTHRIRTELEKLLLLRLNIDEKLSRFKISNGLNKLKICLVSREYPLETAWGGIGRYTSLLANGLVKRGHEVHVITQTFKDEEYEWVDEGVHIHRIKHPEIFKARKPFEEFARRIEYSWRVYKKILEFIDKYGIQIVEGPNFSAECFVYSLFKKTPLVTRIHTPYEEVISNFGWELSWDRRLSCMLEDQLLKKSDIISCSTKIYADLMREKKSLVSTKLKVIPLGIEIPEIDKIESINNYGSNPKPLNVLFVGRLEKRKGIHILFQAIPEVIDKLEYVEFTIVGRDTFFQKDESSFRSPEGKNFKTEFYNKLPEEIKEKVHLVGEVSKEELEKYYKNCDVFVAPSLHETFGYIYLEAMSCGKPVIGCKVGGVPEVIKDGEVGYLIEPENHEQLTEAIVKILKDPKLRFEMGINARRYVIEKFSLENMVEQTEKLYQGVLDVRCRR